MRLDRSTPHAFHLARPPLVFIIPFFSITFASSFTRGNIIVSANSTCNSSPARTLTLARKTAGLPVSILSTIISSTCPNRRYSYSITVSPLNTSGIIWSIPQGATIDSGQGTLKIYVSFPTSAITNQNVSVAGFNGCGLGSARKLSINLAACVSPLNGNQNNNQIVRNNNLALAENNLEIKVAAMPNPTHSTFNISFVSQDLITPLSFRIFDMNGKLLKTEKNIIPSQTITIGSELMNGIYIGEFIQGKNRKTIKLIKM